MTLVLKGTITPTQHGYKCLVRSPRVHSHALASGRPQVMSKALEFLGMPMQSETVHIHLWGRPIEGDNGEIVKWCRGCEAVQDSSGEIIGD